MLDNKWKWLWFVLNVCWHHKACYVCMYACTYVPHMYMVYVQYQKQLMDIENSERRFLFTIVLQA